MIVGEDERECLMDIIPIMEQDSRFEVVKEDIEEIPIKERNKSQVYSGKKSLKPARNPLYTEEGFSKGPQEEVFKNTSFKVRKPLVMHQTLVQDLGYKMPRSQGCFSLFL